MEVFAVFYGYSVNNVFKSVLIDLYASPVAAEEEAHKRQQNAFEGDEYWVDSIIVKGL